MLKSVPFFNLWFLHLGFGWFCYSLTYNTECCVLSQCLDFCDNISMPNKLYSHAALIVLIVPYQIVYSILTRQHVIRQYLMGVGGNMTVQQQHRVDTVSRSQNFCIEHSRKALGYTWLSNPFHMLLVWRAKCADRSGLQGHSWGHAAHSASITHAHLKHRNLHR